MSLPTTLTYETHLGVPLPPSVTASRMRWIWGSAAIVGAVIVALALLGDVLIPPDRLWWSGLPIEIAVGLIIGGGVALVRGLSLSAVSGSAAPSDAVQRARLAPLLRRGRAEGVDDEDRDAMIRWARADVVMSETTTGGLLLLVAGNVLMEISFAVRNSDAVFTGIAIGSIVVFVVAAVFVTVIRRRVVRIARLPMTVEDELPA